jgi:hypothetical protein
MTREMMAHCCRPHARVDANEQDSDIVRHAVLQQRVPVRTIRIRGVLRSGRSHVSRLPAAAKIIGCGGTGLPQGATRVFR